MGIRGCVFLIFAMVAMPYDYIGLASEAHSEAHQGSPRLEGVTLNSLLVRNCQQICQVEYTVVDQSYSSNRSRFEERYKHNLLLRLCPLNVPMSIKVFLVQWALYMGEFIELVRQKLWDTENDS